MLVPPKPVSDAPMESVITLLGSKSSSRSLMLGENSAAVLASRNTDESSYSWPDSFATISASNNGRAIASPVKNNRLTLRSPQVRQTSSALNSGDKHDGPAAEQRHPRR